MIAHESTGPLKDSGALQALRRRAYEELNRAVDEGRSELSSDWLANADPALATLRAHNEPEWQLLLKRLSTAPPSEAGSAEPLRSPHAILERYLESRVDPRLPEPAWGDPRRRRNLWALIVGVIVVVAVVTVLIAGFDAVLLLWVPIVGFFEWRLVRAWRHSRAMGTAIDQRAMEAAEAARSP